MTLKTGIRWVDEDTADVDSCYLKCEEDLVRHKILAHAVAAGTMQGNVLLLSFANRKDCFWSFDFERLMENCSYLAGDSRIKDRLEIRRVNRAGKLANDSWDAIGEDGYDTVIADCVTNMKTGVQSRCFSPLDRVAHKIRELNRGVPVLVLDRNPPYRPLTGFMDSVLAVDVLEKHVYKKVMKHPSGRQKKVLVSATQRSLEEFARPVTA